MLYHARDDNVGENHTFIEHGEIISASDACFSSSAKWQLRTWRFPQSYRAGATWVRSIYKSTDVSLMMIGMREVPGSLTQSELHWFSSGQREAASRFAWLAPPGVLTAKVWQVVIHCFTDIVQLDFNRTTVIDEGGQRVETAMSEESLIKVSLVRCSTC